MHVIKIIVDLAGVLLSRPDAYRVPLEQVGAALGRADPIWIGAVIVAYAVNLPPRTRRWQMILQLVAAIPYRVGGELCSSAME